LAVVEETGQYPGPVSEPSLRATLTMSKSRASAIAIELKRPKIVQGDNDSFSHKSVGSKFDRAESRSSTTGQFESSLDNQPDGAFEHQRFE
jgi:hypothetical protein